MSRVRMDLFVSLDGYTPETDNDPDHPMGADWGRLTTAHGATRTFRERILGDTSGTGTTGIDDSYAAAHFEGVGAEILGATMFGLHTFPDEPDWKGWWGDRPPFGTPVYVLTHTAPRPSIPMSGGTTFHFRSSPSMTCSRRQPRQRAGSTCASAVGTAPGAASYRPAWSTTCTSSSPRSSSVGATGCGTTCVAWKSPTT